MNSAAHIDLRHGNALIVLRSLEAGSVHAIITSPPYWGLRDYGTATWEGGLPDCDHRKSQLRRGAGLASSAVSVRGGGHKAAEVGWIQARHKCAACGAVRSDDQLGLEAVLDCMGWATAEPCGACFICRMVDVFAECRRVLRDDGTCWINMGDSYAHDGKWGGETGGKQAYLDEGSRTRAGRERRSTGLKPKDLCMQPARLALALQADGWYLRSDVIWHKPNPMPESVQDRPTKAHEYVYLLAKSPRYFYDVDAIREPVQPDTPARYERGRSDTHKYADGGPGGQTIAKGFEHMRVPAGWHQGRRANGSAPRDQRSERSSEAFRGDSIRTPDQSAGVTRGKGNPTCSNPRGANKRSVWSIATMSTPDAHFATFPLELPEIALRAASSEMGVCPACGCPWERSDASWRPGCVCGSGLAPGDLEEIQSPLVRGADPIEDPTLTEGRAGMERPRRRGEGTFTMTRFEQRAYARQLLASEHRAEMEAEAGPAFAHYIRLDRSGGRPLPGNLLVLWVDRGWITKPELPQWTPAAPVPAIVMDPFMGAGTTMLACLKNGRRFVGIDLRADYLEIARDRARRLYPLLFHEPSGQPA